MNTFRFVAAIALTLLISLSVQAQSVTVILEDHLGNVATPFDEFPVPGLTDYVGRPKFDARTGGANADQDVRNVTASYTTLGGSVTNVFYDIHSVPSVISNNTLPAVTGDGFLRVGYKGEGNTAADAAWDTQYSGGYASALFEFDVRFTAGSAANDNADGFGFAYVDAGLHGSTGAFYTAGEEPNVAGSLGIGFDIWDNGGTEGPNSISVHYDGSLLASVDLATLPSGANFPLLETGEPIGVKLLIQAAPLLDITRPGDAIVIVSGTNAPPDTNTGPPPGAEGVENSINDVGQKYLNFLDLGSGFAVTPSGNPNNLPVTGVRFYTANDAVPRDPSSFVLSGSDSIDGPWTDIYSQVLSLPDGRNSGGNAVGIPPEGNLSAVHQTVRFPNDLSFDHYRVIFPTLKDQIAANSMQIAEVELLVAVPEPAGFAMAFLALICFGGLVVHRRR